MKKIITLLVTAAFLVGCAGSAPQAERIIPDDPNAPLESVENNKFVIYQMLLRLFGNTNDSNIPYGTMEENGVGKFSDITETALSELKDLGATHIWYTGVIEHMTMVDFTEYGFPIDDSDVIKGRAGSPYAIKDYYDVNPFLADEVENRMAEFQAMVERTHDMGLKAMIDFVPNHVARIYRSDMAPEGVEDFGASDDTSVAFAPNNNYFYLPEDSFNVPRRHDPLGPDMIGPMEDKMFDETPAKATGNDRFTPRPASDDWFETVKLNYGFNKPTGESFFEPIPDTWFKMRDILAYWVNLGVDGFRCDMAEMVPVEFWNWVIPQIKDINPEVIFLAEIYNPAAYENYLEVGQFDYLYDKVGLYDKIKAFAKGSGNVLQIQNAWLDTWGIDHRMLKFMENHDEMRLANEKFAGSPENGFPAFAVSATIGSGPVMIYFGQETGEPANGAEGFGGEDARTTIFDFWGVPTFQNWVNGGAYNGEAMTPEQVAIRDSYQRVLNLIQDESAFGDGQFYDLTWANHRLSEGFTNKTYAFLRYTDEQKLLVLTNFNQEESANIHLTIPEAAWEAMGVDPSAIFTLTELMYGDKTIEFQGPSTLALDTGRSELVIPMESNEFRVFEMTQTGELVMAAAEE